MKNHALFVDEKSRSIRHTVAIYQNDSGFFVHAFIRLVENPESVGQVAIAISKERIGDAFNSATVLGCVKPCKMNFRGIARSTDYQSVPLFKVSQSFLKSMQLRRTDKSKVLWVPKEQNFFFSR